MTYNFTLTDSTALATVEPLESNGYGAKSVPRAVLDVKFAAPNSFIVADDVTARFTAGHIFNVIASPYEGTYTVNVGGSTYDLLTNLTTIPVTTVIDADPLTITGVTPGLNGIWRIVGAINGDCVYYPGATFTVVGAGAGDGVYTVQDSDVSGTYPVVGVSPGPGGVGTTWTFSGGDHTAFFVAGTTFRIGSSNPGAGTYTVVSSVFSSPNTVVTVVEPIPGTATNVGIGTITPAVTLVTVTGTIPFAATPTGTATVPASVAYTFAAPATGLTNVGPNTWQQLWHINDVTGAVADALSHVGCIVKIDDNSVFDNFTMTVAVAATWDTVSITTVTLQYRYVGTPTLPDATGTLTYPLPPVPYGFIQYDMVADTSLKLVGRGSPAFNNTVTWGEALQENDIHLLENFNNTTPPVAPIQGQLWFNQSTSTLFLFTSTIYNIENVNVGLNQWMIDGAFDKEGNSLAAIDLTTVFTPGMQFAVYNNQGINVSGFYSPTLIFEVLTSTNAGVGTDTTITINTTPSVTPPFPVVQASVPIEADDLAMPGQAPYGQLYAMTEWHQVAMLDDVFRLDPKASVKAATAAVLPAYTATGSGPTRTLTATANGVLTVDGVVTWVDMNNDGGSRFPGDPLPASRVLVKDQAASHVDHGIYAVKDKGSGGTPWILVRAGDADNTPSGEVSAGMFTFVEEGAFNLNSGWTLVTDNPIVLETTALTFYRFTIISEPNMQIVYGTGAGTPTTSDPDFIFNSGTNTVQIGAGANVGTITNGGGGTIVFNTGDIILTASNTDQIHLGASINITGANGTTGSTITVTAGSSTAATGGAVNITAGAASGVGNAGGSVTVQGGLPADGNGGAVVITGRAGVGTNRTGGAVTVTAGNGTGTAAGGAISVTSGTGGATGIGGAVTIEGGAGGATSGDGGNVTLRGGSSTNGDGGDASVIGRNATGTNRAGGTVTLTGGNSTGTVDGGPIDITGGVGGATANGGQLTITGGAGGATSGNGGAIILQGGAATDGNGGGAFVTGRNATGTNRNGGAVSVSSGNATGTGSGGGIALTAGSGGATGTAGALTLTAGAGGATSGAGGAATIQGGLPTNGAGGAVFVTGRNAQGAGNNAGGAATMQAGDSTGTSITGGNIIIIAGRGSPTTGAGGSANITGGPGGTTSGNGGAVIINGGAPVDGNGGSVNIAGIAGAGTNRNGGLVTLNGGNATGTGTGGNVTAQAGSGGATGTAGNVTLTAGLGGSTSGSGGNVTLTGGTAVGTNQTGGQVSVTGGTSTGTATGGAVTIAAGTSGTGGAGGNTTLQGGLPTDGNGGNVTIAGRNGVGTNRTGGDVTITAGNGTGTGGDGNVLITAGTGGSGAGGSLRITTGGTERLEILEAGGWEVGGSQGTSGQALVSNGTGTPPTWQSVAAASAASLLSTLTNGNAGSITIGQPVYVSAASTVDLADASATATATPTIGLVFDATIATTASGRIITHGRISNGNWTTATGAATLTTGATYYLSETTGQITTTAPVTLGSWVIPVGIALSTTDLNVNIGTPFQN